MLDIKYIRNIPDEVAKAAVNKGEENYVDEITLLDEKRREKLQEVEQLKAKRNAVSKEIGELKKSGEDADSKISEMKNVSNQIKEIDENIKEINDKLQDLLLRVPNVPDEEVPVGSSEEDNVEVRRYGEPLQDNDLRPHWDIADELGIIDFERAGKITGSRFASYMGVGARLERALINFMIDLHIQDHGYTEVFPPFIVNEDSMVGTGQLPKFTEDMFKLEDFEYYLIPTAEVPLTNLHSQEILSGENLPIYYVAYTACFRREAGAHGRDTRGLIRQHQFNKVELVKFVEPEKSDKELEKLVVDAEKVLQLLGLPYRVMLMCTGDLGFAAAKKYDLEVWLPAYSNYREISSCSNFEDFQARRAEIKYRPGKDKKTRYVHTLNGSGIAVGRTVAAILENNQQPDGSVQVPQVLQSYMGGLEYIRSV